VEEEMASSIGVIGHEGDARQSIGVGGQVSGVHPIGCQAVSEAGPEIIIAHHADEARGHTQAGGAVGEDGGRTGGEGADEGCRPIQRQVWLRPHDLDQRLSDG
jgi:hypothetical protein